MALPERIVRRFLATQRPYVCWYRVSLSEKRGHPSRILVTAALKFTADSPTEKQTMEGSRLTQTAKVTDLTVLKPNSFRTYNPGKTRFHPVVNDGVSAREDG
jgi:hypothetical protein